MSDLHPVTLHQNADEFAEGPDFASNEMALSSNEYRPVFELAPDRGEGYVLGRGQTANPQQAQGHVAMRLMDNTATTAVQIGGQVRLTVRNNNGRLVTVLYQNDLSTVDSRDGSGNLKAKRDREPLPQTEGAFTGYNYSFWIEVKPASDTTVDTAPDSGNTEAFIDGHRAEKTA